MLKRSPMSEAWKEGVWTALTMEAGFRPRSKDREPSCFHLVEAYGSYGGGPDRLVVRADPTISYWDCRGSRHPEFEDRFGSEYVAVRLSASMIVLAQRDGVDYMPVLLRTGSNDYKCGGVTTEAAGAVKLGDTPVAAALRETEEELDIKPDDLRDVQCLGVVREVNLPDGGPFFVSRTDTPLGVLRNRRGDEENNIYWVTVDTVLKQWLFQYTYAITECSIASCLILGRQRYGNIWRADAEVQLGIRRGLAPDEKTYRSFEREEMARLREALIATEGS